MQELQSPDIEWDEVSFAPEKRVVHGAAPPSEALRGWASVGRPVIVPIRLKPIDTPEFLQASAGPSDEHFFLVHLACSFSAPDGEAFEEAWLRVELTRNDGSSEQTPVAWSLDPLVLQDAESLCETVKLTNGLKIAPVSTSVSGQEQRSFQRALVHVRGLNELESNPAWELRRTKTRAIEGIYKMRFVARVPNSAPCGGQVSLRSTVRRKRLLWSYEAEFPNQATAKFGLS